MAQEKKSDYEEGLLEDGTEVKVRGSQVSDQGKLLMTTEKMSFRLTSMRWLGLFLACMCQFGSYYCYDNPQALQVGIQERIGLSDLEYNALYSIYSFPNIVLPLVGGLIVDKLGVRIGTFLFSFILIIGQGVFMAGCTLEWYWLMLVGRFVYGLGGECLCVSQSVVISQWFKAKELALALGINITVSRLGSSANSAITPIIYKSQIDSNNSFLYSHPFFVPTFTGFMFCVISWISGLGMIYMDQESDRREGKVGKDDIRTSVIDEDEKVNLKDLKNFSGMFWILVLNCALIYGSFFAFNANANALLFTMYGIPTNIAGIYLLSIYLSASIITPFFGIIIDKYGKRVLLMMFSIGLFMLAIVVFCLLPSQINQIVPLVPLILTGIFYATYAAIFWPCIPVVVEPRLCGTAFGVVNAVQNINLAVSPIIFGVIRSATQSLNNSRNGYIYAFVFLFAQNLIALIFTFVLYFKDMSGNKALDNVSKSKKSKHTMSSVARR